MSEAFVDRTGEEPTIEVRVFRQGKLLHRELCESEDQAALAVQEWADTEGVSFEVDDLSGGDRAALEEIEPSGAGEDEYPEEVDLLARDSDARRMD